jgi:hypothetical protein
MLNVERLTTVLRTIAVSGLVKNGAAISVTLIAPSDAGKSELIAKTSPPNARVINDFTTASMTALLSEPKPPTWIVVPDFNQVISHKPAVATLTMAFLLSLLAEGITEIPGLEGRAKLQAKSFRKRGVRIALLTGMTPDMFNSRRGKWRSTGLLRRLIPIYYTYSATTIGTIQKAISQGGDALDYSLKKQTRLRSREIIIPSKIAGPIKDLSGHVTANQLIWKRDDGSQRQGIDFPFSLHKVFRNYVKASALLHGRRTATRADLLALKDFSRFVRYDRPEEL